MIITIMAEDDDEVNDKDDEMSDGGSVSIDGNPTTNGRQPSACNQQANRQTSKRPPLMDDLYF